MKLRKERAPGRSERKEKEEKAHYPPCSGVVNRGPSPLQRVDLGLMSDVPREKVDKSVEVFDLVGKWFVALTEFGEAVMISTEERPCLT